MAHPRFNSPKGRKHTSCERPSVTRDDRGLRTKPDPIVGQIGQCIGKREFTGGDQIAIRNAEYAAVPEAGHKPAFHAGVDVDDVGPVGLDSAEVEIMSHRVA